MLRSMKPTSRRLAASLLMFLFGGPQLAVGEVITFEEVSLYQNGVNWFSEIGPASFALEYCNCDNSEPRFGIGVENFNSPHYLWQSAPNAASIAYDLGYSISMTSGARFNFEGANFGHVGGYSSLPPPAQAVFRGYRDGELVYSQQMYLPNLNVQGGRPETGGMPFIEFNWLNIDSLYIQGAQINSGWQSMDNFTFSVVPIPPAVWLFGSALGVISAMKRRTR